jgi:hypothetical protein
MIVSSYKAMTDILACDSVFGTIFFIAAILGMTI